MNQAMALGQHWKDTPITAVYCSDLKRAHTTAQQLVAARSQDANTSGTEDGQLSLVVNPLLREQNFGIAEGKPWAARKSNSPKDPNETEEEVYYTIYNRHEKFPDGESLDDLADRADKALDQTVWPHVQEALKPGGDENAHIIVVSHGLAISELVAACEFIRVLLSTPTNDSYPVLRRSPVPPTSGKSYSGLVNTGWTQLQIDIGLASPDRPEERIVTRIFVESVNNSPHLANVVSNIFLSLIIRIEFTMRHRRDKEEVSEVLLMMRRRRVFETSSEVIQVQPRSRHPILRKWILHSSIHITCYKS
jgi:broad specificity phosphatase PhoE